jgi:hypothetical protein
VNFDDGVELLLGKAKREMLLVFDRIKNIGKNIFLIINLCIFYLLFFWDLSLFVFRAKYSEIFPISGLQLKIKKRKIIRDGNEELLLRFSEAFKRETKILLEIKDIENKIK